MGDTRSRGTRGPRAARQPAHLAGDHGRRLRELRQRKPFRLRIHAHVRAGRARGRRRGDPGRGRLQHQHVAALRARADRRAPGRLVQVGDAPGHQKPARVLQRRRLVRRRGLSRTFLILHGLDGSGPDHWQTWLADGLRERGETVSYPDLPDPFDPDLDTWLDVLRTELAAMEGERILLCHSLATLLWM